MTRPTSVLPRLRVGAAVAVVVPVLAGCAAPGSTSAPAEVPGEGGAAPAASPSAQPPPADDGAAPATGASTSPAAEDGVRVLVIGDEGTLAPDGGDAWPDLLAEDLAGDGLDLSLATAASPGAGFGSSPSFLAAVERHAGPSTQLVVLFDGRLAADAAALGPATGEVLVRVDELAYDARTVVVGPLPGAAPSTAGADAVREAADRAGVGYVDPARADWPGRPSQAEIAALVRPHLEPLVQALARSGANS